MTELQRQTNIILHNVANGTGDKSPFGYNVSMKDMRILRARQQEIYGNSRGFHSWLSGPYNDVDEWKVINGVLIDAQQERIDAAPKYLPFYLLGVAVIALLCIGVASRFL